MTKSSIVFSIVVLACLVTVAGQAQRRGPEGFLREGIPRMPNPPGPAPVRDFSGVWVGPIDNKPDAVPPMTAAGEAAFKERKPYGEASRLRGNPRGSQVMNGSFEAPSSAFLLASP